MTTNFRQRLRKLAGGATVAVSTALFASPFVLVALFLIDQAYTSG